MSDSADSLRVEEQNIHEQEQSLIEEEAEIHAQEEGLVQMERSFVKRNQTLMNLLSYVGDQEKALLERADAIGVAAKQLVSEALSAQKGDDLGVDSIVGLSDERQSILERRREVLAARMEIVEERQNLYISRLEAIEGAEGGFGDMEDKLLKREKVITDTLRKLIMNASVLANEDGDDDDDDEPQPTARAPDMTPVTTPRPQSIAEPEREPVKVVAGESEAGPSDDHNGSHSRREDGVTRRRRGRVRKGTGRFRITLEAILGGGEKHAFFKYDADSPEDLPGLFLATPNLLKEGREVRVKIKLAGERTVETDGVVSWRRQAGDREGPPGMGIEIASLAKDDREAISEWLNDHPPMVV